MARQLASSPDGLRVLTENELPNTVRMSGWVFWVSPLRDSPNPSPSNTDDQTQTRAKSGAPPVMPLGQHQGKYSGMVP
jgi:hypothetical protein